MKHFFLFSCLAAATLVGSACTTEAWYEGVKQSARNDCQRQPPSAVNECLSRVNSQTYQDYEKERSGSK